MKKVPAPAWASEVKALRDGLSLTQEEFAAKLALSKSTVSYWETGEVIPHRRTRDRIRAACEALAALTAAAPTPTTAKRRYPAEAISQMHTGLDIIFDRAPQTVVDKINEFIDEFAGRYGTERIHSSKGEPYMVPADIEAELQRLAFDRKELDTGVILLDVLRNTFHSRKLKHSGERQVESDVEGQARVQRGKKTR